MALKNFQLVKMNLLVTLCLGLGTSVIANPDTTFAQIIAGIRPRGACAQTYVLSTPSGSGTQYWVAPNGNDNNDGSVSAPFATISRAAYVANEGDVVTIRNGTYRGSIVVRHGGTQENPLVIQAENCGGVIITGNGEDRISPWAWYGEVWNNGAGFWTTWKGVVIDALHTHSAHPSESAISAPYAAMQVPTGWRIDNCLFINNTLGMDIRGHHVVVERSSFIDQLHSSLVGSAGDRERLRNLVFRDLYLRGNNRNRHFAPHEASIKILYTTNALVDNIKSHANRGPGWWFDWHNSDFIIQYSYFHENRTATYDWDAVGAWSEVNDGGLIRKNVFFDNTGAGVGLLETRNIEITENLFVQDDIEFRCMSGRGMDLQNININRNTFHNSSSARSISDRCSGLPTQNNIVFDHNRYSGNWSFHWINNYAGLSGMRSLGWEANGTIVTQAWPLDPDSSLWNGVVIIPPVIDTVDIQSNGLLEVELASEFNGFRVKPGAIGYSAIGSWARYRNLNFSVVPALDGMVTRIAITYGVPVENSGNQIQIRLGYPTGTLVASLTTNSTTGWEIYRTDTVTASNSQLLRGVVDLYLVVSAGNPQNGNFVADIDNVQFLSGNDVSVAIRFNRGRFQSPSATGFPVNIERYISPAV